MNNLVKIEGKANLVKDLRNGGVINIDKNLYAQYKLSKNIAMKNIKELTTTKTSVETLRVEINTMKEDLETIKNMLHLLTQKGK
jgi:hypothetical protein